MTQPNYTLWGTPHSFFTGKARSYLLKKRIPFRELMPSAERFAAEVAPSVGHVVMPVLECPSGEYVQDTSAIIDHCEAEHRENSLHPEGQVQGVIAHFLDAFGSNYLAPLAMHYRWTYRAEQEEFLQAEFARAAPLSLSYDMRLAAARDMMDQFAGFLDPLGVTPEVIPAMEESYVELLAALDAHLRIDPYLLGGRPSRADFGMLAPLYAHLARDPVPGLLMKTIAPAVARWTERMNTQEIVDCEYQCLGEDYLPHDQVPASLEPVLELAFAHWGPGIAADIQEYNGWLEANSPSSGTIISADGGRHVHPFLGTIEYPWRNVTMRRACHVHSIWQLQRAQNAAAQVTEDATLRLDAMLKRTGGKDLFALKTNHPIERCDNVLVTA
jgi:glutathione S-transferase